MSTLKSTLLEFRLNIILYWLSVSVLVIFGSPTASLAQQSEVQTLSEQEEIIVERITKKVMQQLLREGALDEAISQGIQNYIKKQRNAQVNAQKSQRQRTAAKVKNVRRVSSARDHIYGNPEAIVSLIEYSDFECPYCKRFHLTAKKVVDAYAGKVNWVYRHFPLAFHNPGAQTQAEASECAASLGGNDAFWKYADLIYERTRSNGKGFPVQALTPLAVEIGLDENNFRECLESGKYSSQVQADYDDGIKIGITGTPGNVLLNNRSGEAIPKSGAVPFESLKQIVDRLLETAG